MSIITNESETLLTPQTLPQGDVVRSLPVKIEKFDATTANKRPFADPTYLFACTLERYVHRLRVLSGALPIAGRLADTLMQEADPEAQRRIIGDPVVRASINEGLTQIHFGKSTFTADEIGEVLLVALDILREQKPVSTLQLGAHDPIPFIPSQNHGWFWSNKRDQDAPARFFRKLYGVLEANKSVLVTPTEKDREIISQAIDLLIAVLPRLSRSALEHVHLVCLCDPPEEHQNRNVHFSSFTSIKIPGTIFLGRSSLRHPWKIAEAILHESLHEKLYCFQHTHSLFCKLGFDAAPKVRALWNRPQKTQNNWWPLSRAIFALHVYVHLAMLFEAMQMQCARLESLFGSNDGLDLPAWKRRALDRAQYLIYHVSQFTDELGPAGYALLRWLTALLQQNDPAPPEPGSYVHLLLDLYQRETAQLAEQHRGLHHLPPLVKHDLERKLHTETAIADQILSAVGIPFPQIYDNGSGGIVSRLEMVRSNIGDRLRCLSLRQCELPICLGPRETTIGEAVQGLVLSEL
jgi:hypothetical protein